MPLTPYAKKVMKRCEKLAQFSQHPDYIDRRYLTKEHKSANLQVAKWMQQAGMRTWQDEAGNQWGSYRSSSPNAKSLIIGSHLDTVPDSGKYDGILGVLLPISLVQYFHDHKQSLPFHLDIVAFADEEGTRFGTTLLGSRAVAGTWQEKWGCLRDSDDINLSSAMREFGLDINKIHAAARSVDDTMGFLEIHIEQGPVLESRGLPVGVVDGIAGAKRFEISVVGHAGHAGTVPMELRQDALAGSAQMIVMIEKAAKEHGVVATVGQIHSSSNAVNVINGNVVFSLDVRSLDNQKRDRCIDEIMNAIEHIAGYRGLDAKIRMTHDADATHCDKMLMDELRIACENSGIEPFNLSSGAGHDAMAIADLCPVAMLFVRCAKGISHHPSEAVTFEDVLNAMLVARSFIELKARTCEHELVA